VKIIFTIGDNTMEIKKSIIKEWIKELQSIDCSFWACPGDNKPYVNNGTCTKCYLIKDMRFYLDNKPRLPEHYRR